MTLFSLSKDRKKIRNNVFIYLGVVAFCIVFGFVYEAFSHGVVSFFMVCGFLFPLTLGLLPYLILLFLKTEKCPNTLSSYMFNAGVATLTVGSYFKGMLDIYGTTRDVFLYIYFVTGCLLFLAGIVVYIISLKIGSNSEA